MKKFRNEQDLYDEVSQRLEENFHLTTDFVLFNRRNLCLVGEEHTTREAVDYVHEHIVPLIQENPPIWLLLREGLHAYRNPKEMLNLVPDHFYFVHLPRMMGIPANDAIQTITTKEIKDYIM